MPAFLFLCNFPPPGQMNEWMNEFLAENRAGFHALEIHASILVSSMSFFANNNQLISCK